jgi:hypothetical protein
VAHRTGITKQSVKCFPPLSCCFYSFPDLARIPFTKISVPETCACGRVCLLLFVIVALWARLWLSRRVGSGVGSGRERKKGYCEEPPPAGILRRINFGGEVIRYPMWCHPRRYSIRQLWLDSTLETLLPVTTLTRVMLKERFLHRLGRLGVDMWKWLEVVYARSRFCLCFRAGYLLGCGEVGIKNGG